MMSLIRAAVATAIALGLVYATQRLPPGDMCEAVEALAVLWFVLSVSAVFSASGRGDAPRA